MCKCRGSQSILSVITVIAKSIVLGLCLAHEVEQVLHAPRSALKPCQLEAPIECAAGGKLKISLLKC